MFAIKAVDTIFLEHYIGPMPHLFLSEKFLNSQFVFEGHIFVFVNILEIIYWPCLYNYK